MATSSLEGFSPATLRRRIWSFSSRLHNSEDMVDSPRKDAQGKPSDLATEGTPLLSGQQAIHVDGGRNVKLAPAVHVAGDSDGEARSKLLEWEELRGSLLSFSSPLPFKLVVERVSNIAYYFSNYSGVAAVRTS
jgi:hypothetical protein